MRPNLGKKAVPKKIDWNEKLTTEILSLDGQHSILMQQFNAFIDAIEKNDPRHEIVRRFEDILNHTQKHFSFEEQIMRNIGFKEYNTHKSHHATLIKDALEILQELKEGATNDDIEPTVYFLRALIVKHMVEQDLKIRDFVTQGAEL